MTVYIGVGNVEPFRSLHLRVNDGEYCANSDGRWVAAYGNSQEVPVSNLTCEIENLSGKVQLVACHFTKPQDLQVDVGQLTPGKQYKLQVGGDETSVITAKLVRIPTGEFSKEKPALISIERQENLVSILWKHFVWDFNDAIEELGYLLPEGSIKNRFQGEAGIKFMETCRLVIQSELRCYLRGVSSEMILPLEKATFRYEVLEAIDERSLALMMENTLTRINQLYAFGVSGPKITSITAEVFVEIFSK